MKISGIFAGSLSIIALVVAPAGCDTSPDEEYARPDDIGAGRTREVKLVESGKIAYDRYCIGCHGEKGDGNGDAARFLMPKPRNFTLGEFKFSSTRSGEMPTDDDLRRTIKHGLKGSAMPPFELLSDGTVDSLVAYVKTFSPNWNRVPLSRPIPLVDDPYRSEPDKTEAIARGEVIYHGYAACWTCHPSYVSADRINETRKAVGLDARAGFRNNLEQAEGKENTQGELIYPPDFRRDFVRGGMSVDDLYRSIAAGITGTAMPTWVDSMEVPGKNEGDPPLVQPSDLWAMAYYVQDLIRQRPARMSEDQVALRDRKHDIYLHGEPPKPKVEPEEEAVEDIEFEFD